jgi:hypothetical protein
VRAVGIVGEVSVKRVHWYRVGAEGFYGCGNGCRKTVAGSEGFLEGEIFQGCCEKNDVKIFVRKRWDFFPVPG